MPKYTVYGIFTATKCFGEFEAENEEAAIEMASCSEENHASLCHQCSREIELDGTSASSFIAENEAA